MYNNPLRHIAVAGNIGSGKTTLSESLSRHYGWDVHFESTDNNPYLNDFYLDMERWSFNLQIYFLHHRFEQILKIHNGAKTVIQDRTIYEDAYIFAPNLHEMGLMSSRDYRNYLSLFEIMTSQIRPPDLLIYLKASIPTLVSHIHSRGRDYEGNMSLDYLKRLNQKYETWIDNYTTGKLLVIPVDDLDFKTRQEDLGTIVSKIDRELFGLFT